MPLDFENDGTTAKSPLNLAFDQLCAYFDAELVRQRAVFEACREQGEAIRSRDVPALETASQALVSLMKEALDAEKERLRLLHEVVTRLGLRVDGQTLTGLIAASPEHWASRMSTFQVEIRGVLSATRKEVRQHAGFLRRAGRILERSMNAIVGTSSSQGDAYDREGKEPSPGHRTPALVNTLG